MRQIQQESSKDHRKKKWIPLQHQKDSHNYSTVEDSEDIHRSGIDDDYDVPSDELDVLADDVVGEGTIEAGDTCTLFVGDLAKSVTESDLHDLFENFGNVLHVEIKRDKVTQNNLGYGFVQFENQDEAKAAKHGLHHKELNGRKTRIGWAQKSASLFVFNLPAEPSEEELKHVFSKFGPLSEKTCIRHGVYGYVRFRHRIFAERARAELDGKTIGASASDDASLPRCRISWGDSNTQHNCVHFRFDFSEGEVAEFTEEDVEMHFSQCGEVSRVTLPRFPNGSLKGYGFVHFEDSNEGEAAAAAAINYLHESKLLDLHPIVCNFGKKQLKPKNSHSSWIDTRYPSPLFGLSPIPLADHSYYFSHPIDFYGYPVYVPPHASWVHHATRINSKVVQGVVSPTDHSVHQEGVGHYPHTFVPYYNQQWISYVPMPPVESHLQPHSSMVDPGISSVHEVRH